MKKVGFVFLLGLLTVLTGCLDDDDYSLGDAWFGIGTIQKSGETSLNIKMDNNDLLIPLASNYPPNWMEQYNNGQRVSVNYTILDEDINSSTPRYFVKINRIDDILTKGIIDITEENTDSIGSNPIIVRDCWMTDSLLNFQLKYWGRYKVHFINLVKEPGELGAEGQPFELELRHNSNNDDEAVPYTAFVSFRLNRIKVAGLDSVSFRITSTDYDGKEFEYNGVYKYGENN